MDQLSTGRRDQPFLALRLAAIEGHLDNAEPLPVIVHDILIPVSYTHLDVYKRQTVR